MAGENANIGGLENVLSKPAAYLSYNINNDNDDVKAEPVKKLNSVFVPNGPTV